MYIPFALVVSHSFNALAESEQGIVDVTSLFDPHTTSTSLGRPLCTSQVHYGDPI